MNIIRTLLRTVYKHPHYISCYLIDILTPEVSSLCVIFKETIKKTYATSRKSPGSTKALDMRRQDSAKHSNPLKKDNYLGF